MNYSTAVMLINQNIRAIKTVYEDEIEHKHQTPVMFKTLDQEIKVGDFAIIPSHTRHKKTVVKVTEVDCDLDFESDVILEWVIDKVVTANHEKILVEEKVWLDALQKAEKRRKRDEIKKSMLDMYKEDGVQGLGIATMGGLTALTEEEAPKAKPKKTDDELC